MQTSGYKTIVLCRYDYFTIEQNYHIVIFIVKKANLLTELGEVGGMELIFCAIS